MEAWKKRKRDVWEVTQNGEEKNFNQRGKLYSVGWLSDNGAFLLEFRRFQCRIEHASTVYIDV